MPQLVARPGHRIDHDHHDGEPCDPQNGTTAPLRHPGGLAQVLIGCREVPTVPTQIRRLPLRLVRHLTRSRP